MVFPMVLQEIRTPIRGQSFRKSFHVLLLLKIELSKEKILKTFLKIPITIDMNSNIFENNEDFVTMGNQLLKK